MWVGENGSSFAFVEGAAEVSTASGGILITGLPSGLPLTISGPLGGPASGAVTVTSDGGPVAVTVPLDGAYMVSVRYPSQVYPVGGQIEATAGSPATGTPVALAGVLESARAAKLAEIEAAYAAAQEQPVMVQGYMLGASKDTQDKLIGAMIQVLAGTPPQTSYDFYGQPIPGSIIPAHLAAVAAQAEAALATYAARMAAIQQAATVADVLAVKW